MVRSVGSEHCGKENMLNCEIKKIHFIECCYCEQKFSKNGLLIHVQKEHIEQYANDNNLLICPICKAYASLDITQHILKTHKITTQEFQEKYNMKMIHSSIASKRNVIRHNADKELNGIYCELCNQKFMEKPYKQHFYNYDAEHTHKVYTQDNISEWVECKICGFRALSLFQHIQKQHNLTIDQYKCEYGVDLISENSKTTTSNLNKKYFEYLKTFIFDGYFDMEKYLEDGVDERKKVTQYCNEYLKVPIKGYIQCNQCHFSTTKVEFLNKHVKKHIQTKEIFIEKKILDFYCSICDLNFQNYDLFFIHCKNKTDIAHSHLIYNDSNKNCWVECQISDGKSCCGFRSARIDKHLQVVHKINVQEYKSKFGDILSNDLKKTNKENGELSKYVVDDRIYKHQCSLCTNIITGKNLICVQCKLKKAQIQQEEKFKDKVEGMDFVRCKCNLEDGTICNWPDVRLTAHIKLHGYNAALYKEHFPEEQLYCYVIKQKVAFRGVFSEESKIKMSKSRMGYIPWNKGLTKDDHEGLQKISEKASIRFEQLNNNPWHTNPLFGDRNKRTANGSWSKDLTKETSESVEKHSETKTGLFNHKSYLGDDIYNRNKIVESYVISQKRQVYLVDSCCVECGSKINIHIHHMFPKNSFDYYDLTAHDFIYLVPLCGSCHSSQGKALDIAMIAVSKNIKKLKQKFPVEYKLYEKWIQHTTNREMPFIFIKKGDIQRMTEQERLDLADNLFCKIRSIGVCSYLYSDIEMLKDFENIKASKIHFKDNVLSNHDTSGFVIREHFIKQQYSSFQSLFDNDQVLKEVILNRLGFNKNLNGNPEFFHIYPRAIVKGFEVIYPKYRFSKYQSAVAKWIIENFCEGNVVYDYSAGWGARLLACAALRKQYICVDSNEELVSELLEMKQWLKNNVKPLMLIDINYGDATQFLPTQVIDMAYSCPPYADQEKYPGLKYKGYDNWLNNFMIPIIKNCHQVLRKKGTFVCHLTSRYVDDVVDVVKNNGFTIKTIVDVSNATSPLLHRKKIINEKIIVATKIE